VVAVSLDLALPRDVEPTVAQLDNIFLYNLDDLATIAEENRAARVTELVKARAIVAEKADLLWKQVEAQVLALAPAPTADLGPALPHPTHQRAD